MRPKQSLESDTNVEGSVVVAVVVDCASFVLTTAQPTHGVYHPGHRHISLSFVLLVSPVRVQSATRFLLIPE